MTTNSRQSRTVSWELLALFAMAAVLTVGVMRWYLSPEGQGEVIPPAPGTEVDIGSAGTGVTDDGLPFLGSPDAPVTMYEFSDFQCPFCADFVQSKLPEIAEDYVEPGDVRLVWIAVAFDGPESVEAGRAAMCALDQGLFWPMHDWLYANKPTIPNSGAFTRERLLRMAEGAGVDTQLLEACMNDPASESRIRENEAFARSQSVDSTPNFLVGDRLIEGADLAAIKAVLDDALGR